MNISLTPATEESFAAFLTELEALNLPWRCHPDGALRTHGLCPLTAVYAARHPTQKVSMLDTRHSRYLPSGLRLYIMDAADNRGFVALNIRRRLLAACKIEDAYWPEAAYEHD